MIVNLLADATTQASETTNIPLPPWATAFVGFIFALGFVLAALGGFYWKFSGPFYAIIADIQSHLSKVETKAETAQVTATHASGQAVDATIKASEAAATAGVNGVRITNLAGGLHTTQASVTALAASMPATPTTEAIQRAHDEMNQ